ncbi:MAG: hypothetical protein JSS30_00610 [Verrucomicrobia bacterium]|nr:hypothetical protein [Verrucomicrobiota bacterium]
MTTVHLKQTPGWFYNTYKALPNVQQASDDTKKGIHKIVWEDKTNSYRTIKSVGNLAGPLLFGLFNPTSLSMFSWITPGLAAIATGVGAIPHEVLFKLTTKPFKGSTESPAFKRIVALAGNSALEATVLMVISTLAQDYLYIPRYVSYPALGVTCALLKVNLNLYALTWPAKPKIDVKISVAK